MNKKILIFGGTGAIGFSIAKKISEENYTPVIISRNIDTYDGFIALGCVIKGKTPHFKLISRFGFFSSVTL